MSLGIGSVWWGCEKYCAIAADMSRQLKIAPHLSVEELEINYRRASNPIERTRYQIIWLLAKGRVSAEVAQVTGYSQEVVRRMARRYNQAGIQGLADRRQIHPGGQPMLSDTQQALLWQALSGSAPDGGLWNGRKVADWIGELIGHQVSRQRGWEYLRQMTFRQRVPRPQHTDADPLSQQQWKKNSPSS